MSRFFYIGLLFSFFSLYGQTPYSVDFTVENGLPSSEVYDIIIDDNNIIWITTDRGLSSYDGLNFENFNTSNGLADNTNFYFNQLNDGEIWLSGFNNSLSYIRNDSILQYKYNSDLQEILRNRTSSWVKYLDFDSSGYFLIPFQSSTGLEYYNFNKNRKPQINFKCKENNWNDVGQRRDTTIDIGMSSYHFYVDFLVQSSKVKVSKILIDPLGCTIYHNSNQVIKKCDILGSTSISKDIANIQKIYLDNKGDLFVCTKDGLLYYEKSNLDIEPKIYFEGIVISAVKQDFQGNYWVTTNDSGVKFIPSFQINHIHIENDVKDDISYLSSSICDDAIVFGSSKSTLVICDSLCDCRSISVPSSQGPNTQIYKLGQWKEESLILSNGLLFDLSTLSPPPTITNMIYTKGNFITKLKNKDFIVHTRDSRFAIINNKTKAVLRSNTLKKPLFGNINSVSQDKNEDVYLGTMQGLFKVQNYQYDNIKELLNDKNESFGRVSNVKIRNDNSILVSTLGQGAYLVLHDKTYKLNNSPDTFNPMVNNAILLTDSLILLGTNNGIDVISYGIDDTVSFKFKRNINKSDGLISNNINDLKFWNGYIWAATNNGICRFDPDIINRKVPQIPIYITDFENQDSTYSLGQNYNFKHYQNDILISYSGLSFKQQNKQIQYKYRLIRNNDSDQSQWYYTNDRNQRFNDLPPGDYLFEVNAENALRIWNDKPASISFTIKPHLTQTLLFKLSMSALGLILIYIIYRSQVNRIKKQEQDEKALAEAKQKTQEAELAAIRNQMNPHFVYNSLNSIQNLIFKNDKEGANRYMSKFSKLMRQSLQFTRLDFIDLEKEIQFLTNYLDLEALRFPDKFKAKFKVSEEIITSQVLIPSLILQPIVENSIKHGFNNISYKGIITIEADLIESEYLQLTVSDNGKGAKSNSTINKDSKTFHESIGVDLVKTRLDLLNGAEFKGQASMEEIVSTEGYTTKIKIPLIFRTK